MMLIFMVTVTGKQLVLPYFNTTTESTTPPEPKCPELPASDLALLQEAIDMYESGLTLKGGVLLRNVVEKHLGPRPDLNSKGLLAVAKEILGC